jgi:hypothetical protein
MTRDEMRGTQTWSWDRLRNLRTDLAERRAEGLEARVLDLEAENGWLRMYVRACAWTRERER